MDTIAPTTIQPPSSVTSHLLLHCPRLNKVEQKRTNPYLFASIKFPIFLFFVFFASLGLASLCPVPFSRLPLYSNTFPSSTTDIFFSLALRVFTETGTFSSYSLGVSMVVSTIRIESATGAICSCFSRVFIVDATVGMGSATDLIPSCSWGVSTSLSTVEMGSITMSDSRLKTWHSEHMGWVQRRHMGLPCREVWVHLQHI